MVSFHKHTYSANFCDVFYVIIPICVMMYYNGLLVLNGNQIIIMTNWCLCLQRCLPDPSSARTQRPATKAQITWLVRMEHDVLNTLKHITALMTSQSLLSVGSIDQARSISSEKDVWLISFGATVEPIKGHFKHNRVSDSSVSFWLTPRFPSLYRGLWYFLVLLTSRSTDSRAVMWADTYCTVLISSVGSPGMWRAVA